MSKEKLNGKRPSKFSTELAELAWAYVLRHNREFPQDPRFVDVHGEELITTKAPCFEMKFPDGDTMWIHVGHGLGEPCLVSKNKESALVLDTPQG